MPHEADVEPHARSRVEARIATLLEPGEQLLWSGTPAQGILLRRGDAFLIPLGVMWVSFAVGWTGLALIGPWFLAIFGLGFVALGVQMFFVRFFTDRRLRTRTAYALTDRRVIILAGVRTLVLRSLALRTLDGITLEERADGSGTIIFGNLYPPHEHLPPGWPDATHAPCFDRIPHARDVHARILHAQHAA